jgi:lysophospholipase L1-like esterase
VNGYQRRVLTMITLAGTAVGGLMSVAVPVSAAPAAPAAPAVTSPLTPATAPPTSSSQLAQCHGTSPITCHYDVAPGNYDVQVVLGGSSAGVTGIQAEARRVLLAQVSTAAGKLATYTFSVNVRNPEGQPTGEGGVGTTGLTLVFNGSAPRLNAIGVAPAAVVPPARTPFVLYLAGDSTVCDQPTAPYTGWGQELPQFFGYGLSVANYADSGESSGSWLNNSKLFGTMKPLIKTNDYVLIQFGHNDKTTTAANYSKNLTSLVTGVRSRGGIPVLVTPPVRRAFGSDGKLTSTALHVNSLGVNLPATMRSVAKTNNVPLIDLTAASATLVQGLGKNGSSVIYLTKATDGVSDNTHFSPYGATQLAGLVVQAIRDLKLTTLVSDLR